MNNLRALLFKIQNSYIHLGQYKGLCLEFDESMNDLIRITCIFVWLGDHRPFLIEKINCGDGERTIWINNNDNQGSSTTEQDQTE
ncbi:unnamed protein product (macronuclear) [Paramecium tetraurelia]|uniref:LSM domain-containing protein n=1 Tax=Paramecium tetraurelia TaxID=5888 RepID=A0E8J7_PARTE|nr:uncharacterized protein GSPATT00024343001 [Paramecium tetraurelia]CAK91614.1 unnamed protein product [Paramecium tetraurelia]|eukprot:XP_001459011.1 hypothetical protein (macronuclear) [Paramecium tetraurelia strain d4-2]